MNLNHKAGIASMFSSEFETIEEPNKATVVQLDPIALLFMKKRYDCDDFSFGQISFLSNIITNYDFYINYSNNHDRRPGFPSFGELQHELCHMLQLSMEIQEYYTMRYTTKTLKGRELSRYQKELIDFFMKIKPSVGKMNYHRPIEVYPDEYKLMFYLHDFYEKDIAVDAYSKSVHSASIAGGVPYMQRKLNIKIHDKVVKPGGRGNVQYLASCCDTNESVVLTVNKRQADNYNTSNVPFLDYVFNNDLTLYTNSITRITPLFSIDQKLTHSVLFPSMKIESIK